MPQMSQVLRERAIVMLTAGMSTRAVTRELNVHFSTISVYKGVSENLAEHPTGKCYRSLSSAHEKLGQIQKCCSYIFVQCI